jgi:septal ring factor EnvC (AmiA/AmiB activator)
VSKLPDKFDYGKNYVAYNVGRKNIMHVSVEDQISNLEWKIAQANAQRLKCQHSIRMWERSIDDLSKKLVDIKAGLTDVNPRSSS